MKRRGEDQDRDVLTRNLKALDGGDRQLIPKSQVYKVRSRRSFWLRKVGLQVQQPPVLPKTQEEVAAARPPPLESGAGNNRASSKRRGKSKDQGKLREPESIHVEGATWTPPGLAPLTARVLTGLSSTPYPPRAVVGLSDGRP